MSLAGRPGTAGRSRSPPQQTAQPGLPCPCQFGARLFQLRLKPRPVGVQFGVFVRQGLQFIEHGGHIPRHADLIGFGMVSLGPRLRATDLMVATNQTPAGNRNQ